MSTVNIASLDKAEVLIALFKASQKRVLGTVITGMSHSEATKLLQGDCYFDYLQGFVMKVDLGSDDVETCLYDRDNGEGAFKAAIAPLLAGAK